MAVVCLAHDLKHHRPVAIKVLRPELALALGAERFLREIEIAARLTHPHILPLFDSGEADGFLYYVTPYVDGESLRDRLSREKQLPLDDALQIAREIADALSYAHGHDVVHRDIKPENVLLEVGHAVVSDFGIARAITAAGADKLTATGLAIGTPAYMSPEQGSAAGQLDGRSDVYALGCVLYEMLAGDPPFTGPTAQAICARHSVDPVPSLRTVRQTVPEHIEQTIIKALAKVPADRFATADLFAQGLAAAPAAPAAPPRHWHRRLPVALAAVAVLAAGYAVYAGRRSGEGAGGSIRRVAVLPFENLGRPEDEYFADGMTEEITTRLASTTGVIVIARRSASEYKGSRKPLREIARELGVQYVLQGTVRWEAMAGGTSRVHVSPELIRVADNSALWTSRYDRVLADVFEVQAQIAAQVAGALGATLLEPQSRRMAGRPTTSLEAYEYYLRGRQYLNRGRAAADLHAAVDMFERAVALDPQFALGYAALCYAHLLQFWFRYDPSEARLARARATAERSLELDPALPEGHVAMGYYHYFAHLDYESALREFSLAQRSRPQDVDLLVGVGSVRRRQGRFPEALEAFDRVEQLDPRDYRGPINRGETYFMLRQYSEADRELDQAILLNPTSIRFYGTKASLLLARDGTTDGARRLLRGLPPAADLSALPGFWFPPLVARHAILGLLDDAQRARFRQISLDSAVTDTATFYLWKAVLFELSRELRMERAYSDSAARVLERQAQDRPADWTFHSGLGLAYAGQGRWAEALREAETGVALIPWSKDAVAAEFAIGILAQVEVGAGRYGRAIDHLEELLSHPSWLSAGWLRVDPVWDPLRHHPGFQDLLERKDGARRTSGPGAAALNRQRQPVEETPPAQ
jgi:eukaryotic-like serine/threonine-protein kinase